MQESFLVLSHFHAGDVRKSSKVNCRKGEK